MDVKKEWYSLDLALGLKQPTLEEIEQNKGSIEACKREMLIQWLKQVDNSKPTYPSLEAALRNKAVNCMTIANTVHQHYTAE